MAGLAWCRSWLQGKAPPGERHSSPQNTSFALQSGGVLSATTPFSPKSRALVAYCQGHRTPVAQHPAQQRPAPPHPSSIHVAKASYSSLVCVTPHLGCVWDTQMHTCTYLFTMGPDHILKKGCEDHFLHKRI